MPTCAAIIVDPNAMQINVIKQRPCGKLTPEECTRRMAAGLCTYCGVAGHFANDCPNKLDMVKKRDTACKATPASAGNT